jgi:CheY-like chemotaxis protein
MTSMLGRHGYCIVEAATAAQTVTAAHNGVEAILLDTSPDGLNGWEVLPLLRRVDPEAHTPVVLLSLDADPTQVQPASGLPDGILGWTRTPIEEDAMLNALTDSICGPGEKARVLIVEENLQIAEEISESFARKSIAVRLSHTLEDAVDSCFTYRPHLLVLNIGMPDGDGFNLVDWLRQHESLARLPLAIYECRNISETERKHLNLGPTHFLSNARVQPQQLEALVLTMLRNPSQVEETAQQAS